MNIMRKLVRAAALTTAMLILGLGAVRADEATADDIARFLAGLPPSENSPLAPLTKEAAWKQHEKFFDSDWKSLEARQLSKVREWSAENIKQPQPVLFYMFSGPDFLYANAFFPDATTYVMSGLELSGNIPDASALTRRTIPGELNGIRASLGSLLRHSYFITSEMSSQLSRRQLSGTLPVIYVFLARSGKTIKDVSLIAIDKEGKVHPQNEPNVESSAKGAKIVFAGSDGREQTLYYIKTDLSDKGTASSGFLKFCEQLGGGDAFIKSASYLLHNAGFSSVRNFLLKNSVSIVQDDTGIPVQHLNSTDWQLHPFGTYLRPIREFSHAEQPKLVELFKKSPGPLRFTVGYRWGKPSNLLLAVKTAPKMQ